MKIAAIIVLYNPNIELLIKQFESVCNQVEDVIYVDNASSNYDDFITAIGNNRKKHNIHIIKNDINMGLGYAHNQGIQEAKKIDAFAVLVLDHDSVLKPNFVYELTNSIKILYKSGVKVAAVGPIYINESTEEQYPITSYVGPFIKRLKPSKLPVEASVLISSGSLIPIDVLHQVGGMNEDLFIDYIDIEWSFRARSKGYKLYAIPSAIMNHQIGDNRISIFGRMVSIHSPLRRYYLSRNSIYMLKCPYVSVGYKLRELTFNALRMLVFALISDNRMLYIKYSLKGVFDGIKGKYGKCPM